MIVLIIAKYEISIFVKCDDISISALKALKEQTIPENMYDLIFV
jgi:hypothetical protein